MNEVNRKATDQPQRPAWADGRSLLVFGGSFDPPTNAHVQLPEYVRQAIDLDLVLYIPAGRAPHKLDQKQTDAAHRLAMLQLALQDQPNAAIWDIELPSVTQSQGQCRCEDRSQGKPSYTVATLESLRALVGSGVAVRFLMGTDQLLIFDSWCQPARIEQLAEPVVMVRPPHTRESVLAELAGDQRDRWAGRLIEVPTMDISSTAVRQRVRAGRAIDNDVPAAVTHYIDEHHLYR